ncbi:uncharacterized protein F4822DRAFT_119105 [Hypoxylon trugodes]|uniref:uncharacterized protein n=1 Tax=Hypoxylon trugodes TaxID=326681 RepID=UPI0021961420|nr:uncharacterized protein F4822DRAFT_119105 [Hypoxylon trugodes]KAI1392201.1 hypothetical protein F4822DRAFT_119105 [Hypoxylon trugodes]
MASFGRSFKPSSYLSSMSMKRRPPPPARTMSSSSEASPLSSPDIRQDDIIFSTRPSPSLPMDKSHYKQPGASPKLRPNSGVGKKEPSLFDSPRSTPARTRPIAIELPTTKKVNSAPVYTPPAPLSARGDLPGGYFPLHEDQNRVYCPHPFQLDASKARLKSIERAGQSGSPDADRIISTTAATGVIPSTTLPITMAERSARLAPPPQNASSVPESTFDSGSNTPVASYMPTGTQDSPLPMGKYYPSNYVKRKEEKRSRQQTRPPTSNPIPPVSSKSETQVPTTRDSAMGHSRNESDAKRRLQQYQRDMIAQATLALNGGNVNAATLNSLRTIGFTSMSSKPSKPRLAPLGSPGPVTPMELEGSDEGGYLGARGPTDAQVEEIARAIRAEEDRKRREGATSPAVELGPSTF